MKKIISLVLFAAFASSGTQAHASACDKFKIEQDRAYQFITLGDGSGAVKGSADDSLLLSVMGARGNPAFAEKTGDDQYAFVVYETVIPVTLGQKLGNAAKLNAESTWLSCKIHFEFQDGPSQAYRVLSQSAYGDYVLAKVGSKEPALIIRKLERRKDF